MIARLKRFSLNIGPLRAALFFLFVFGGLVTVTCYLGQFDVVIAGMVAGSGLAGFFAPAACLGVLNRRSREVFLLRRALRVFLAAIAVSTMLQLWTPTVPVTLVAVFCVNLFFGLFFWPNSAPNVWSIRALAKLGFDPKELEDDADSAGAAEETR